MRVLICGNNSIIVMDLAGLLEELGHTICGTAKSCAKALDLIKADRPDVAVVDLNLDDGHTGLFLIEVLAGMNVPSIIISAEASFVPEGCSALARIEKPFTSAAIADALRLLDRSAPAL